MGDETGDGGGRNEDGRRGMERRGRKLRRDSGRGIKREERREDE